MTKENYEQAQKLGKRAFNRDKGQKKSPYLISLEEVAPDAMSYQQRSLNLVSMPLNRVVGTATQGRMRAFASNFMPILDEHSEFASKWEQLYNSVVSEGVNTPIKAYEYMNRFYVIEGNKRVSVMKFLDSASIEGEVIRLIPPLTDDPAIQLYYEFLSFYDDTGLNIIEFSHRGGYDKLYDYTGTVKGERWSTALRQDFRSAFTRFSNAYHALGGGRLPITDGDAFLVYLRIYGFKRACDAVGDALRDDTRRIWDEITISAQDERVVLMMDPVAPVDEPSFLTSWLRPRTLKAAFLYNRAVEESGWTYWHELGRAHVDTVLEGRVETQTRVAVTADEADAALEEMAASGVDVAFTTSPVFLDSCVRASLEHRDMKILNCSLLAAFHHVRSYYLRVYEAKFVLGAIAGALAENNRVGYIADYPIYGTPANINAFALGARFANPRAQVFLEWSGLINHDPALSLERNDVSIVCNRDVSAPAQGSREFGLYRVQEDGMPLNLAMPVLNWGSLYETILRSVFSGSWQSGAEQSLAMAYWPGMSTGAVDVIYSQKLPDGTQQLAETLRGLFKHGGFNPFTGRIVSQDGVVHTEYDEALTPGRIVAMNWLCDNVIGAIPDLGQLREEARPLVRLQGIYDSARPDPNALVWTGADAE